MSNGGFTYFTTEKGGHNMYQIIHSFDSEVFSDNEVVMFVIY